MLELFYQSIENVIYLNFLVLLPATLYLFNSICENDIKCEQLINLYLLIMMRTYGFFTLYNFLGKRYLKKWDVNQDVFRKIDIVQSFILSVIPVNFYNIFWALFFYKYSGEFYLKYAVPITLLITGFEI